MATTRIGSEQARLKSSRTGEHILDTYLEACELGDRQLPDLLSDLFDTFGIIRTSLVEFREDPLSSGSIQYRIGVFIDPSIGWLTMPFTFSSLVADGGDAFGSPTTDILDGGIA